MRAYNIIAKKRDAQKLSADEIDFMVQGFVRREIPDYQMSAFLMATYIQGLDREETIQLTKSMIASGEKIDLSTIKGMKVDKHSTGGVGDKTTLVLAPLVAAAGVPVAKMSGRGLGHTGGTLDKLESIPGFRVDLSREQFIKNVNDIGLAIISPTINLVPADKNMYALRDVTATVSSIPLIASSVMSKKIAAGTDAIVLDVKTGSGAFMKNLEDSFALAKTLVSIGVELGRETVAIVSNMDQPLGYAVGNSLEVKEAIETLQNKGPRDLLELSLTLGSYMLVLAQTTTKIEESKKLLSELSISGKALDKFRQFIKAQGGDTRVVDSPELLSRASLKEDFRIDKAGFISFIDAEQVGKATLILGGGRLTKESPIDLSVGVVFHHKVGEKVGPGNLIAEIYGQERARIAEAKSILQEAIVIQNEKPAPQPLIYGIV